MQSKRVDVKKATQLKCIHFCCLADLFTYKEKKITINAHIKSVIWLYKSFFSNILLLRFLFSKYLKFSSSLISTEVKYLLHST